MKVVDSSVCASVCLRGEKRREYSNRDIESSAFVSRTQQETEKRNGTMETLIDVHY